MSDPTQNPIDRIFDRLTNTYGVAFLGQYAGAPLSDVKTIWAHELANFESREGYLAIAWALGNLPERPPNAIQFRNLCRQAPGVVREKLPPPQASPERVAQELARLGKVRSQVVGASSSGRDWARALRGRERNGARLSIAQREMVDRALPPEPES